MNRDKAYQLLTNYLSNKNLIKHCLACETGMKTVYKHLYAKDLNSIEEEKWGITGLLHDIDYEFTKNTPEKHGMYIFDKEPNIIPDEIAHAIKSHNFEGTKIVPETKMDWAIYCIDQLTGLIVAAALVTPEKKLSTLTTESVLKRMKEKSFAKGARREPIKMCEEKLGIPLTEFASITLNSMQKISQSLGL